MFKKQLSIIHNIYPIPHNEHWFNIDLFIWASLIYGGDMKKEIL